MARTYPLPDGGKNPKLTKFGTEGGAVEIFPQQPAHAVDPNTLAAHDSLALQGEGVGSVAGDSVVTEEIHADEFILEDEMKDIQPPPSLMDDEHSVDSNSGNRARRGLRIALLLAIVLAVVLATVLTRDNRNGDRSGENNMVAGAQGSDETPSPVATNPLELTMEYQLLEPYVQPPSKLLDPSTPQGKAFAQLVSENITEDFEFRAKQRFAMMVVFFSMGGESWSWKSGWSNFSEDECDWHGVAICRYVDGRRITAGLQLPANNAVGGVPEEICLLENLETLSFENNQLGGSLPACLTSLLSIFEFNVHNNAFSGIPPSGFFDMPRLETLDLSSNAFTGELDFLEGPQSRAGSVDFVSQIRTLRLDNNEFEGNIPDSMYNLNSLEELTLQQTSVWGDVSALCSNPAISVLSMDCSQVSCNESCCTCA